MNKTTNPREREDSLSKFYIDQKSKAKFLNSICCYGPLEECNCSSSSSSADSDEFEGARSDVGVIDANRSISEFNVIQCLGKGGFGNVYLVTLKNDASDTYRALKVVDKNSIKTNAKDIQHSISEAAIMKTIDHPFIVKVYDTFQTPRRICYLMEFLQGGELYTWLERKVAFDEPTAKFYLAQIFLALVYLHGKGIMYRDLKPENVMFDSRGNARLIDFGLSQNYMKVRNTSTMCGTTLYMSPEVICKNWYSYPADWWSFGIMAYDMLVGNPPFVGDNRDESRRAIIEDPVNFPKESKLSAAARLLIADLLEKDPDERLCGWEIVRQPFFNFVNFDDIYNNAVSPPIVPEISSKNDLSHFSPDSLNVTKSQDEYENDENDGATAAIQEPPQKEKKSPFSAFKSSASKGLKSSKNVFTNLCDLGRENFGNFEWRSDNDVRRKSDFSTFKPIKSFKRQVRGDAENFNTFESRENDALDDSDCGITF